jgi:hypothetical protein
MGCKFKLPIKNNSLGKNSFHCLVIVGADGWAYTWYSDSTLCPCNTCQLYTEGKEHKVNKELKSDEFWKMGMNIITGNDWKKILWIKEGKL